jgi:hypothetical protein
MSDPKSLSTTDWLGIGGLLTTIGGAVLGVLRVSNAKRDERITNLEGTIYGSSTQEGFDTKLAVLTNEQKNTCQRLTDMKESVDGNNNLIRELLVKLGS